MLAESSSVELSKAKVPDYSADNTVSSSNTKRFPVFSFRGIALSTEHNAIAVKNHPELTTTFGTL
jgi:hypothetical protein